MGQLAQQTEASDAAPASPGGTPSEFKPQGFVGVSDGQRIDKAGGEEAGGEDASPADPPETAAAEEGGEDPKPVKGRGGEVPAERVSQVRARARASERAAVLKELFNTDDLEEAKARLKELGGNSEKLTAQQEEYERLKQAEEDRKREAMTEQQKLQADLDTANARIKELEAEYESAQTDIQVSKQDSVIAGVAGKYIRPERIKYAKRDLADHIRELPEEEQQAFSKRKLDGWFLRFARENPDFAIAKPKAPEEAEATEEKPKRPAPKKRVLSSPKRPPATPPTGTSAATVTKTPRPGQPNSMNKAELKAYLAQKKIRGW